MKKFDTQYVDSNTYPIRLDACLENLCSQVGLTLGNKNFPNNSYMLKGNPFTNKETRKTVLSNLVQLAGGFAEIDVEDGKLYVRNLDVSGEAVETIDGNNYDEFKPNNVFGPVNSVRIQMNSGVDGEETIKEAEGVTDENRCQITIADNYYLTSAEEREAVINGIFNALNGLTYLPIELSYYGYPWLKLGDKIKVKDKNDKEYITYVMEHTLKYNGAYSGTIKAIALTKTQQAYKEVLSLKDWRRNTELAVDKINGKMTAVIEEQSEQSEKITKVEQDVNGITSKVSSVETQVNNITNTQASISGKNIHIEDSAEEPFVEIKIKGETNQATRSGKNILNKNATIRPNGVTKSVLDTGVRITQTTAGQFTFCGIEVGGSELLGKTLRTSANWTKSADNVPYIAVYFGNSSSMALYGLGGTGVSGQIQQITLPNVFPTVGEKACDTVCILLYSNRNGTGNVGDYVDYTDLIVTIDNEDMSYEDYGASPSPDYPSEIENLEGNIEIKDVGKNLLNITATSRTYSEGVTITVNKDKSITISGTNTSTNTMFYRLADKFVLPAGDYTLSNKNANTSAYEFLFYDDGNNFPRTNISNATFTKDTTIKPYIRIDKGITINNQTIYPMILKGTYTEETIPVYTPYQERKEYFPLSEGQKLYKGSYLADDGIHHKRKQVVLNGINNKFTSFSNIYNNRGFIVLSGAINSDYKAETACCSHFKYNINVYNDTTSDEIGFIAQKTVFYFRFTTSSEINALEKANNWLSEQYTNGTPVIVEYELAEEEIVPYTEEQQEAWDKIKQLHTYKNVTNIFSDAELDIVYVRDNGLSDMYETKQNANKEYKKTTQKLAEHEVTADSIKASVEETKESINALDGTVKEQSKSITSLGVSVGKINANITDLKENTEQSINEIKATSEGLSIAITNVGGNNLIKNSAMINDNNFWLKHAKFPYIESSTVPENPAEGTLWYCTQDNSEYIANQMYIYNGGKWQTSAITRKSIYGTQNYMENTTSNEYWADGKSANESTLSGRVIKLDGKQDYSVSHIFNITEPIVLNQNESKLSFSYSIKNSSIQGNMGIGLMFLNEEELGTVEMPYSVYEPGLLITPDELKTITKIEQIIDIPKKEEFIPVVVSSTAPTNTAKNWLDTSVYLPKKYNAETSQWELINTTMSLYNESTREVWTYRFFYGFYYQTPVNYDSLEIKSCYVALTYYPAFAVYTGSTEPTPYKGLYWNNQTSGLVKRAKYNGTNFVEWETLDIPSGLLPTGASLGTPMFDYIVPVKGFFEIADLKLEYNAICTKWTQFPGEVYGKNYKMDEKGFWIQSQQNTMYIDEDEILATYKGINIFQINKDLAYFYKVKAKESVQIGDYFLKEQQINNKNMLLFY